MVKEVIKKVKINMMRIILEFKVSNQNNIIINSKED